MSFAGEVGEAAFEAHLVIKKGRPTYRSSPL